MKILKNNEFGENGHMEDKTNKRFGRLVALYPVRTKSRVGWFCKCDCGNEVIIQSSHLKSGFTKSCGCIKKEIIVKRNHKGFKGFADLTGHAIGNIRYNARKRNMKFEVTPEYLWSLYLQQDKKCALSGLAISFGNKRKNIEQTASLDRIDSDLGYILGNVHWVHKTINIMKGKNSEDTFIKLCKLIIKYHER